jgi:hypothetical protein
MNTPVSFPIAKLLKEKGFDEECDYLVYEGNKYQYLKGEKYRNTFLSIKGEDIVIPNEKDWEKQIKENPEKFDRKKWGIKITAPTIADVVMWLYEKHGIWVSVDWMKRIKPYNSGFYCHLRGTNKSLNRDNFIVINDTLNPGYEVFNSPTEAYEAAIEYILNNLI